jgi:arylsulfatase A-like enzyme
VNNPAPDAGLSGFGLPPSEITLAEALKPAGYATAAIGKWHLGHEPPWLPRSQGFDDYFGILYSNDMYPVQLVHNEEVVEYPVVQATLTKRYTERALQFIEANQHRPFFLYLPHAMPHKPLAASADFYTPDTPDDLYADVIAELDWSVGQILQTLRRLGLERRTSRYMGFYVEADLCLCLFPDWFAAATPDWPGAARHVGFLTESAGVAAPLDPQTGAFLDAGPPPAVGGRFCSSGVRAAGPIARGEKTDKVPMAPLVNCRRGHRPRGVGRARHQQSCSSTSRK